MSSFKEACGSDTLILPGFDLSTTFWKAGFDKLDATLAVGLSSASEESESE